MQVPIHLPELGFEAVVFSVWYANLGDEIVEGDRLAEVLADCATFDVAAPVTGRLIEQHAYPDDVLSPGQTLGVLQVESQD